MQNAFALRRAAAAEAQQAREPSVGGAVDGEAEQAVAAGKIEPRADDELDAGFLRLDMRADHAGQRVAVGDGDGLQAERRRLEHQLLRVRAAAQEAEIGRDLKLGVIGHAAISLSSASTPCTAQRLVARSRQSQRRRPAESSIAQ